MVLVRRFCWPLTLQAQLCLLDPRLPSLIQGISHGMMRMGRMGKVCACIYLFVLAESVYDENAKFTHSS